MKKYGLGKYLVLGAALLSMFGCERNLGSYQDKVTDTPLHPDRTWVTNVFHVDTNKNGEIDMGDEVRPETFCIDGRHRPLDSFEILPRRPIIEYDIRRFKEKKDSTKH